MWQFRDSKICLHQHISFLNGFRIAGLFILKAGFYIYWLLPEHWLFITVRRHRVDTVFVIARLSSTGCARDKSRFYLQFRVRFRNLAIASLQCVFLRSAATNRDYWAEAQLLSAKWSTSTMMHHHDASSRRLWCFPSFIYRQGYCLMERRQKRSSDG